MKASKLIEKINNKEIKSGTHIKIWHTGSLKYTTDVWFHGNWFSREPYTKENHPERYDDIILKLCDENTDYEIVKEPKNIEKLDITLEPTANGNLHFYLMHDGGKYNVSLPYKILNDKIDELIDYINKENK